MEYLKALFLILSSLFLFGCSTLERSMAGKIGCPHDEIQILETSPGWGVVATTWKAKCHNRTYICSLRPGAKNIDEFDNMSCARNYSKRSSSYSKELDWARNESFEDFVNGLNETQINENTKSKSP